MTERRSDRLGWEVAFLIGVLGVGGLALVAIRLLIGAATSEHIPGSGAPSVVVELEPVRMVVGLLMAAGLVVVAVRLLRDPPSGPEPIG